MLRVARAVVFGEDLVGFGGAVFGDEPAGRFRHEVEETELEERVAGLEDCGTAPGPGRGVVLAAECCPGGDGEMSVRACWGIVMRRCRALTSWPGWLRGST